MTAVATAEPPDWLGHAPSCPGGCPRWVGVDRPTCQPYPCRCAQTKADGPEWGRERCWWTVKTTGRITSRCPCWGRTRDEGLPGSCCAHHSANPRYAAPVATTYTEDLDVAPLVEWPTERVPVDVAQLDWSHLDVPTHDPEIEYPVYVRRWTHAELHCDCPEPATWPKSSVAVHCCDCHTSWANPGTMQQHRRRWTEPCRDPNDIRDVDTGFFLLRQGADGIWFAAYPTAE